MRGGSRRSDMKLVILLSIAALAACDYSGPQPETPSDDFGGSKRPEEETATIAPGKAFLSFKNIYQGAFPPAKFPSASFLSTASFPTFGQPLKAVNFAAAPQLPPLSQVLPPISQVVPPIFGNVKPSLPSPSFPTPSFPSPSFPSPSFPAPSLPAPSLPPTSLPAPSSSIPQLFSSQASLISKPLLNKFTSPYSPQYYPLYQFPYNFPSTFSFPLSTFSFPTQTQKQPAKAQTETLSTSYGPPASGPVEQESSGPAESSAPFDQAPVSYPYEPAAPEEPEPEAPHKPAQEYGPPSN